jgi:hypothetical protein
MQHIYVGFKNKPFFAFVITWDLRVVEMFGYTYKRDGVYCFMTGGKTYKGERVYFTKEAATAARDNKYALWFSILVGGPLSGILAALLLLTIKK